MLNKFLSFTFTYLVLTLSICNPVIAQENSFSLPYPVKTMLLPISINPPHKTVLEVKIPMNFKQIESGSPMLFEFIPDTDKDPYQWSEIITVRPFVGSQFKANDINAHILQRFKGRKLKIFKIIEQNKKTEKNYETASSLILYSNQDRLELLYLVAYSGPMDSVSVQYAKLLASERDSKSASKQIKTYFNNNVKVTVSDKSD